MPSSTAHRKRPAVETKSTHWRHVPQDESPTAEQITASREYFGLTQREAADVIGYSRNGWQRFEQDERTMRPKLWQFWLSEARELKQ
jgi:DNA-binding XRE family transcriptional regulator